MPSKSKTSQTKITTFDGVILTDQYRYCASNWVLKNGKPDIHAQNPHDFKAESVLKWSDPFNRWGYHPNACSGGQNPMMYTAFGDTFDSCEQIALAKFNGKIRKGRASLGVTIGSWGQSSRMITTRLRQASKQLDSAYKHLSSPAGKARIRRDKTGKEPLAGLVLEGEFGWRPLIGDIKSALGVIAGDTLPTTAWVTGRHREAVSREAKAGAVRFGSSDRRLFDSYVGWKRVSVAASVRVSNPNLFLLNSLGLLNPLEVAWDLIPWSFVAGMFVNVGSMIKSLTDYVGLDISDKSVTKSSLVVRTSLQSFYDYNLPLDKWFLNGNYSVTSEKFRTRSVGALPPVKWQVQVPSLNLEQMIIAASLVTQRVNRINQLLSVTHPFLRK